MANKVVRTIAVAFFALFCASFTIWKFLTFVPDHLDSDRTLRFLLLRFYSALVSLTGSPDRLVIVWQALTWVALLTPFALAALDWRRPGKGWWRSKWVFAASIVLGLLVLRLPVLFAPEFNPDESEFTAAATALYGHPVFWNYADTHTSGPINIYPLALPALLGFTPDYASSRLIGILFMAAGILLVYRAFALVTSDTQAKLATLPIFIAFTSLRFWDFLHTTSENTSFVIVGVAVYATALYTRDFSSKAATRLGWLLGVATTVTFLAKMQGVPIIAAVFGIVALQALYKRQWRSLWRVSTSFSLGVVLSFALHWVLCEAFGSANDFWMSYIVSNVSYVAQRDSFADHAGGLWGFLTSVPEIEGLLGLTGIIAVASLAVQKRGRAEVPHVWGIVLGIATTTAALLAIFVAGRAFPHYLLLLVVPCGVMAGYAVLSLPASSQRWVPVALVLIQVIALGSSANFAEYFRNVSPTLRAPESLFIAANTRPGSGVVVWGWSPYFYLASGRPPATRDTQVTPHFYPAPEAKAYYNQRILRDLARSRPDMFVDAVHEGAFKTNDPGKYGYHLVPGLRAAIDRDYRLLASMKGMRFFARRDLAGPVQTPFDVGGWPVELNPIAEDSSSLRFVLEPLESQQPSAVVLTNETSDRTKGFRLEHLGAGQFQLGFSTVDGKYVNSRPFAIPLGKPAKMEIFIGPHSTSIHCNGDVLEVDGRVRSSPEKLVLGGHGFHAIVRDLEVQPGKG